MLGPELVSNPGGPFITTAGWYDQQGNAPLTVSGGNLIATPTTTAASRTETVFQTEIGKWYKATIDVLSFSGAGETIAVLSSSNGNVVPGTGVYYSTGVVDIYFLAVSANTYISIGSNISTIGVPTILAFLTVKELAGNHASQATAASRPLYTETGLAKWTDYDAVDDVLNTTFPSALGSSCTVARANVGAAPTILTAQTIGTSYADSTDNAGLIIVDRALTTQETN